MSGLMPVWGGGGLHSLSGRGNGAPVCWLEHSPAASTCPESDSHPGSKAALLTSLLKLPFEEVSAAIFQTRQKLASM